MATLREYYQRIAEDNKRLLERLQKTQNQELENQAEEFVEPSEGGD